MSDDIRDDSDDSDDIRDDAFWREMVLKYF